MPGAKARVGEGGGGAGGGLMFLSYQQIIFSPKISFGKTLFIPVLQCSHALERRGYSGFDHLS